MTFSQSRAHFLRQEKGRPQTGQVFSGSPSFFRKRVVFAVMAGFPLKHALS